MHQITKSLRILSSLSLQDFFTYYSVHNSWFTHKTKLVWPATWQHCQTRQASAHLPAGRAACFFSFHLIYSPILRVCFVYPTRVCSFRKTASSRILVVARVPDNLNLNPVPSSIAHSLSSITHSRSHFTSLFLFLHQYYHWLFLHLWQLLFFSGISTALGRQQSS